MKGSERGPEFSRKNPLAARCLTRIQEGEPHFRRGFSRF